VHQPIIEDQTFKSAQDVLAGRGRRPCPHRTYDVRRAYAFGGSIFYAVCQRRMQGQWINRASYYRCRFPAEYARANKVERMARYKAAIDVGGDPAEIGAWLSEAKAQRVQAEAELRRTTS
jgi:site-specific DNA recombinase